MTDRDPPDFEARVRAEVERAVAPYLGIAPPVVLAKMRELNERFWRENPEASRVLRMETNKRRIVSGTGVIYGTDDADDAKEAWPTSPKLHIVQGEAAAQETEGSAPALTPEQRALVQMGLPMIEPCAVAVARS